MEKVGLHPLDHRKAAMMFSISAACLYLPDQRVGCCLASFLACSWNQFQCNINQATITSAMAALVDRSRLINGKPMSLADIGYTDAGEQYIAKRTIGACALSPLAVVFLVSICFSTTLVQASTIAGSCAGLTGPTTTHTTTVSLGRRLWTPTPSHP